METAGGWTSANATLADEATIQQEGTNSMKMTVVADTIGEANKAITVDLSVFSGPVTSPDADFIECWVFVDNPANIEFLQVVFNIGTGTYTDNFFTYTIPVAARLPLTALDSR